MSHQTLNFFLEILCVAGLSLKWPSSQLSFLLPLTCQVSFSFGPLHMLFSTTLAQNSPSNQHMETLSLRLLIYEKGLTSHRAGLFEGEIN